MVLDGRYYLLSNKKLFLKKVKRYSEILECSRKGYRKSKYLKWKKRVMKRAASTIIRRKVKRRR